jgi:hypothetical protein
MSNYFMPHIEAKKPIEDAGIRVDIDKQQKKMTELFNELREFVVDIKQWYHYNPAKFEFFRKLSKKLKKEGIDENRFADFIKNETEKTLRASRRAVETDNMRLDIKIAHHSNEEFIARGLVFFAECMKDAARKNMSVSELFDAYRNKWEREGETYSRKTQKWIEKFRDDEDKWSDLGKKANSF